MWRKEVGLAFRSLCRARTFSAVTIVTLTVGIAGTIAMFALVQAVLLRSFPVAAQDRLIVGWKELRSAGLAHWPFVADEIAGIRRATEVLDGVAGVSYYGAVRSVVLDRGAPGYVHITAVTGEFFQVLGVEAEFGRTLRAADDVRGAENVLVISEGLWRRRYGGTSDVLGQQLIVFEQAFTIVGVMPSGLEFPRGTEAWMTVAAAAVAPNPASSAADADPDGESLPPIASQFDLLARLRPGTTRDQAAAELRTLLPRLDLGSQQDMPEGMTPVVQSFEAVIVGDVRATVLLLFAAVGVVLLIASANAANLLLVRGEGRRSEFALRAALGAGRGAMARQVLAESAVLAAVASAAGVGVVWWTLQALVAIVPSGLPRLDQVSIDGGVVAFAAGLAFLTAALAGIPSAVSAMRTDLVSQLRSGSRTAGGTGSRGGRKALVVVQVALAVSVIAAAGLLARSLWQLQSAEMGFTSDRLVLAPLSLPPARYAGDRARHTQFLDDVVTQLASSPGIEAVTPVNVQPFSGTGGWELSRFTAEGQGPDQIAANPSLNLEAVHHTYFDTLQVAIARGRAFTPADRQGAVNVAIVTEDVAARAWPGQDPIGKRLKFGDDIGSDDPWLTVVGIAAATRYRDLRVPRSTLYVPAEQFLMTAQTLALRTSLSAGDAARLVRQRVEALDPDVLVLPATSFTELTHAPLAGPRFSAVLIGVFGAGALLLAAVGLYAVVAAYVRQRYNEIGVRLAVGATASDIRGLVLGEGLRLAAIGSVIGLAITAGATPWINGLLFEVQAMDPVAIVGATILLIAVAALASYVPARRASRIDPMSLLRTDGSFSGRP